MPRSAKKVIYVALFGDLAVAVTKFVAAYITGSSTMSTEAVHSLVDTSNEVLLLYGLARSRLQPDLNHPLGYGRELYFWSFIVALSIFAGGAGVSIYEGYNHIRFPTPISHPFVNYIVLAAVSIFEGSSWVVAMRAFRRHKGEFSWWQAVQRSRDPATFVVLFEDSAALVGIIIAIVFISLSIILKAPVLDGVGSLLIGIVLGAVALVLAYESKGLLIGAGASPKLNAAVKAAALRQSGVCAVNAVRSYHLAPDQIVVTISLDFNDDIRTSEIEVAVMEIERRARCEHPEIRTIFIRPESRETYGSRRGEPLS